MQTVHLKPSLLILIILIFHLFWLCQFSVESERQLDNKGKQGIHHNSQGFKQESITVAQENILYF